MKIESVPFESQQEEKSLPILDAINYSLITITYAGECGSFIDFMLDKILRTLKVKGKAYEPTDEKSNQKSSQKILSIMKSMPDITMAEIANATGLSFAGVKKNIRKLKDANLIRRVGLIGIVGIVMLADGFISWLKDSSAHASIWNALIGDAVVSGGGRGGVSARGMGAVPRPRGLRH